MHTILKVCGIRIQSGSAGFNPADERFLKESFWNSTRAIFMERKAVERLPSKAISELLTHWMGRKA